MFVAEMFETTKKWKQCECPSTERCICAMEYYSAIKRNEVLLYAMT